MAGARQVSQETLQVVKSIPQQFQNGISAIIEGRNPGALFPFTNISFPRGVVPHNPHTDLEEVRKSVTIRFHGVPENLSIQHLFHDGELKTRAVMHAENNRRRETLARLTVEEAEFPLLGQTLLRQQAYDRMMFRIRAVRDNDKLSVIAKQLAKSDAQAEYDAFLEQQRQARDAQRAIA